MSEKMGEDQSKSLTEQTEDQSKSLTEQTMEKLNELSLKEVIDRDKVRQEVSGLSVKELQARLDQINDLAHGNSEKTEAFEKLHGERIEDFEDDPKIHQEYLKLRTQHVELGTTFDVIKAVLLEKK